MSSRLSVARHHLDTGNPQRALEVISALDAGELQGAQSEAYELAARAYLELGDPFNSRVAAKRSLAIDPTNLDALLTLAWSSSEFGDRKTVASSMRRARELDSENVVVLVDSAILLINEGRLPESAEFLWRAQTLEPENLIVRVGLMEHAYASADPGAARFLARSVLAEHPDHLRALVVEAALAGEAGDIRTTAKRLRRVASLRLGDQVIAADARYATAWSNPWVRPAWWIFRTWLGVGTVWVVLAGILIRLTDSAVEGDVPLWSVALPILPMVYLLACWIYVRRRQPPRT